jgi:uncharacterized protein (TIGR00255 family)
MIHSMTGFARTEARFDWGALICELRSVNHRYLEVTWRLPEELRQSEGALREQIAAVIKRGKVDCALRLEWTAQEGRRLEIDRDLVEQLAAAAARIGDALPDPAPVSPLDIMRWPGVVGEQERDIDPVAQAATELVAGTLRELAAARRREGERISAMLTERCASLGRLAGEARQRLPEIRQKLRERLLTRIAKLDLQPDEDRLEQELVLQAQKMDVDEELDRIEGHVLEVREALGREEPVGRRLDFLMQEFNREANTLASKSQDPETTRIAVEMKVLIEQMREQVQNVQ